MSHRPRAVNGVKHRPRCACPSCDPQQLLVKRARTDYLNRPPAPPSVAAPLAAARHFAPRPRPPETEISKRFRELLRAGVPAAVAIRQIDAEQSAKGTP